MDKYKRLRTCSCFRASSFLACPTCWPWFSPLYACRYSEGVAQRCDNNISHTPYTKNTAVLHYVDLTIASHELRIKEGVDVSCLKSTMPGPNSIAQLIKPLPSQASHCPVDQAITQSNMPMSGHTKPMTGQTCQCLVIQSQCLVTHANAMPNSPAYRQVSLQGVKLLGTHTVTHCMNLLERHVGELCANLHSG